MGEAWRRFRKDRAALFGAAVIAVVVTAAVLAPWVTPYDPNEQFFDGLTLEGAPLPPNERFWMGTDLLGRDVYTRLVYGARGLGEIADQKPPPGCPFHLRCPKAMDVCRTTPPPEIDVGRTTGHIWCAAICIETKVGCRMPE